MGYRQVVRHSTLTAAFAGSSPASPCYTEDALEAIEQYKKEQREMRRVKVDK